MSRGRGRENCTPSSSLAPLTAVPLELPTSVSIHLPCCQRTSACHSDTAGSLMCSVLFRVRPTVSSSSPALLLHTVPVQGPLTASKDKASCMVAEVCFTSCEHARCSASLSGASNLLTLDSPVKAALLPLRCE